MSDDVNISRRSVLSVAALGLAGSSIAVAKRSSSNDAVFTEYDADTSVDVDASSWPMPDYDGGRTKYNPQASVPTGTLIPQWKYYGRAGVPTVSDGVAYFITGRIPDNVPPETVTRTLHAHDVNGSGRLWKTELGTSDEWHNHRIAVADGVVYASQRSHTQAFDAIDGSQLWSADTGGYWLVVTDESLVVHGGQVERHWSQDLVVLSREDGSVRWKSDYGVGKPAVVDESAYTSRITDEGAWVYSFDVETGKTEWTREMSAVVSIATESELYVDQDDTLLALNPETGETKWEYDFTKVIVPVDSEEWGYDVTVHVVDEEQVYVECTGNFFALDAATGEKVWRNDEIDVLRLVGASDGLYHIVDEGWRDDKPGYLIRRDKETGEVITKQKIKVSEDPVNGREFVIANGRAYTTIGRYSSLQTVALGTNEEEGGDDGSDDSGGNDDSNDDSDDADKGGENDDSDGC